MRLIRHFSIRLLSLTLLQAAMLASLPERFFVGAAQPASVENQKPSLSSKDWASRAVTFDQRVAYQRAIDEIYWRHRVESSTSVAPEVSFDQSVPRSVSEAKVREYLRRSNELERRSGKSITAEMLQSEVDRMARDSRDNHMLSELWGALRNDRFLIAECLARPLLVSRVSFNSAQSTACLDGGWSSTNTIGAPSPRYAHTAVWTGGEMIVWGGYSSGTYFNDGGRYDPATDSWTRISAFGAPSRRRYHVAVWTGSEMVIWGGSGPESTFLNTGGRYNPSTDSWSPTSISSAATGRYAHRAVWTGSEMIIWGGNDGFDLTNTGARYRPSSNTWAAISTPGSLEGRRYHSAVWTGTSMIVWGGQGNSGELNSGGLYDPSSNSWTLMSTSNAPSARDSHSAVWTGNEMIIWGGLNDVYPYYLNSGSRYNPASNSWSGVTMTGTPGPRAQHTAIWTGSAMVVWGGVSLSGSLSTGGHYDPTTNSWNASSTAAAPPARYFHTAIWTGGEMVVWGGPSQNSGGRYCPGDGQPPDPQCSYSIDHTSASFNGGGGNGSFNVSAGRDCSWTASSSASWITVTSGTGTGDGVVSFFVSSNRSGGSRKGFIRLANQVFTVKQSRR